MTRRKYTFDKRTAYLLVVIFASAMAGTASAIWYAGHVDRESNQRWCGMVVRLDDTYREKPPNSDLGRELATEFSKLRQDFGCNTIK